MGSSPVDVSLEPMHASIHQQYNRYQYNLELHPSQPTSSHHSSRQNPRQPPHLHYSDPHKHQAYVPTFSDPRHPDENKVQAHAPLHPRPPRGLNIVIEGTGSTAGLYTFHQDPTAFTTLTSPSTIAPTPRHRSPQPGSQERFMPYSAPRSPRSPQSPPSLVSPSSHLVRSPTSPNLSSKFLSASLSSPPNILPSPSFRTSTTSALKNNPEDRGGGQKMGGPVRSPPRAHSQSSNQIERTPFSSFSPKSSPSVSHSRQHHSPQNPVAPLPPPLYSAMEPRSTYTQSFTSESLPESYHRLSSYASHAPLESHFHQHQTRPAPQDPGHEYPQQYPTSLHHQHGRLQRHVSYSVGDHHRPHERYMERRNSYGEGDHPSPHTYHESFDHYPLSPDHAEHPMVQPSRHPPPPHTKHYPPLIPFAYHTDQGLHGPSQPHQYHPGPLHSHPHSKQHQQSVTRPHYEPHGSSLRSPTSPPGVTSSSSRSSGSPSRHTPYVQHYSISSSEQAKGSTSKLSLTEISTKSKTIPATTTTQSKSSGTGESGNLKTTRRRRRPNESYSIIIVKAIQSSPYQRLKLSEIYNYVSKEIPHMGNDKGWQNTVRHNLSHMKCFRRIMAKEALLMGPLTTSAKDEFDPSNEGLTKPKGKGKATKKGKGGYWILVPEYLEETSTQIRPKKSSVDHAGLMLFKGTEPPAPPTTVGAPKRKGQDLSIPTHQQHRSPSMMDHGGSLASASSLWASKTRFSEHHRFPQPLQPQQSQQQQQHPSFQPISSHSRYQGMDLDKDVASMKIASVAASLPYHSQSNHPGQHASFIRPSPSNAPHSSQPIQKQQQQHAFSTSRSVSNQLSSSELVSVDTREEESETEHMMASQRSSRLSESSRGEEDELEDDDNDYDDEEEEEEEEDEDNEEEDEEEDEDDRSTSSRDSRLGAGMSIHHLLN